MSSIELNDVTSGYNLGKISDNFDRIERVINEEVLHRVNVDDTPNSMETDIDMNGQHIYNLPKPVMGSSPLRVKDLFGDPSELLGGPDRETIIAGAGQTVFTLATDYVVGSNSILVFRNGVLQTTEYNESSINTVTFPLGVDAGDEITVVPVAVTGGDIGEGDSVTIGSNIGTGAGVFSNKSGNSLLFKSLKQGTGVTITPSTNEILISADNPSVTGSNLGSTGEPVFSGKVGNDFQFKRLRAGTNVSLSSDSTGVVISSTGGGGGGSPVAVYDNGVLKTADATSLNFINTTVGASGGAITVQAPSGVYLNVKDYGAIGDGVTNDSAAIQTAITAAKAANRAIFFPDGTYSIPTLGTQNGRIFLIGTGNSIIKGTFTYYETSFPISADTNTPLTPTADYFSAQNLCFQSTNTDFALKLTSNVQPHFVSTFNVAHCKFYGNKGLLIQHMIGFEVSNCEFNNVVSGTRIEGSTNGLFLNCRWQNQAESGVWITNNVDFPERVGGENMKFVLCEWAVCTFGIVADQHTWLVIDSCLLDYCGAPLFLSGSKYAKASNTYFGASNIPVTRFSSVPGFISPGPGGIAVYGRPGGSPVGSRTVGFTAHNCEFINYNAGSTSPIITIDGFVNSTFPNSAEYIGFYDCHFWHPVTHNAQTMVYFNAASIIRMVGNRFVSYNNSTTLVDAWRAPNCTSYQGFANDFLQCQQSFVSVGSTYEKQLGNVVISGSDPGATIGAYGTWIVP